MFFVLVPLSDHWLYCENERQSRKFATIFSYSPGQNHSKSIVQPRVAKSLSPGIINHAKRQSKKEKKIETEK